MVVLIIDFVEMDWSDCLIPLEAIYFPVKSIAFRLEFHPMSQDYLRHVLCRCLLHPALLIQQIAMWTCFLQPDNSMIRGLVLHRDSQTQMQNSAIDLKTAALRFSCFLTFPVSLFHPELSSCSLHNYIQLLYFILSLCLTSHSPTFHITSKHLLLGAFCSTLFALEDNEA